MKACSFSLVVCWLQANGSCRYVSDAVIDKVWRFIGFWLGKE